MHRSKSKPKSNLLFSPLLAMHKSKSKSKSSLLLPPLLVMVPQPSMLRLLKSKSNLIQPRLPSLLRLFNSNLLLLVVMLVLIIITTIMPIPKVVSLLLPMPMPKLILITTLCLAKRLQDEKNKTYRTIIQYFEIVGEKGKIKY